MSRVFFVALLTALALAPRAGASPAMLVGASEDLVKSSDLDASKAQFRLAGSAGLGVIRITAAWSPGQTAPAPEDLLAFQTTARAAALTGIRLVVAVAPASATAVPLDDASRAQFAAYAAALALALPEVRDFVVGDEPNSSRSWAPQFNPSGRDAAGTSYVQLLAATYDALKAVDPRILVLGGALAPSGNDNPKAADVVSRSPGRFLLAMGAAYRASGRTTPIMDELDFHPYGETSAEPPSLRHAGSTTISIADYPKLVGFLKRAFDGTAQPGSALPIVYDQYGVQTIVPPAKSASYTNLSSPLAGDAVADAVQASYYRQALTISYCQPTVAGLLFRRTVDDPDLGGWQSGLFYADLTPKPSLKPVQTAVVAARRGSLASCPGLAAPVELLELDFPETVGVAADNRSWPIRVGCVRDCVYLAYLERLPTGTPALATGGALAGGILRTITLPARRVTTGTYRLTIRIAARYNPGQQLVQSSDPIAVG